MTSGQRRPLAVLTAVALTALARCGPGIDEGRKRTDDSVNHSTSGCDEGFHLCGETCVSGASPDSCGLQCGPCPQDPHGTSTCDGAQCGIACDPGYQDKGSGACEPTGGCGPCPQDPHGTATCDGTSCGLQCNADYRDYGDGTCQPADPCATDTTCTPAVRECLSYRGVPHCGDCIEGYHEDSGACVLDTGCVRYVDAKRAASGNGLEWAQAFKAVQEGLDSAGAAAQSLGWCEVWVSEGVYFIYGTIAANADHHEDTVTLKAHVALYGGFSSIETARSQRHWLEHPTVLDGHETSGSTNRVWHVVTGGDNAVLDGFVITGGHAAGGWPDYHGAGMFNNHASPTVRNCVFRDNQAEVYGGGVINRYSTATFTNCLFVSNSAYDWGGGMHNYYSSPTLTNCTFAANVAALGGGMHNRESSTVSVYNSIFWGNEGGEIYNDLSFCTVASSVVQWGYATGIGIISVDPQFVTSDATYRLQAGSACIDAGDDGHAPARDLDNRLRIDVVGVGTSMSDIGACEYQP